ncbi:carboxymuconolactone decarboxylase family protein [Falsiroseomonas sp.]|uniref:carboxymuconolactone decarboxylase family protein n=1 Tax=Falsiroseomonas sp. TaxID=2870721 RepID=UPI003F6FBEB8
MTPRITLPEPEAMNEAQRALRDQILASGTGSMVGPQRANIHSPDLAEAWWKLGDMLRLRTVIPKPLLELAIIVAGRRWNSQLEFHFHGAAAIKAGIAPAVVEAIRACAPPVFEDDAAREVYEYTRQIQVNGAPDDASHAAITARWGERGVVELTAMIGFYTMVCIALNAHRIPLPEGLEPPFPAEPGFSTLPPAA